MKRLFADTSYWIALLNPRDQLHSKAVSAAQSYADAQILTSEMVLVELLNGFSDSGHRVRAALAKAVKTLCGSPNVTVIPQTSDQFQRALGRYEDRVDLESDRLRQLFDY